MLIKRIENATRELGAPPNWNDDEVTCNSLPIRDVETPCGPFMVSAWEPTAEELKDLQAGATIKLWINGKTHPVVTLSVGDLP